MMSRMGEEDGARIATGALCAFVQFDKGCHSAKLAAAGMLIPLVGALGAKSSDVGAVDLVYAESCGGDSQPYF